MQTENDIIGLCFHKTMLRKGNADFYFKSAASAATVTRFKKASIPRQLKFCPSVHTTLFYDHAVHVIFKVCLLFVSHPDSPYCEDGRQINKINK